jgi:glycosyltransferase involved in cell wall biosynthesis
VSAGPRPADDPGPTSGSPPPTGPVAAVSSVSACFPCYNDAPTIATMVLRVRDALDPRVPDYEIVVVDDGSSDDSVAVLRSLAERVPELRVVVHEANRGYGGALLSAFGAATKEWVFYTDGDAQYDPTEVGLLLDAVRDDVDIVQGWKIGRGDRWHRVVIGRVYHHVVRAMFGLRVRDTDCDFRLFRRSLVDQAGLRSTSGVICVEMMRRFQELDARFVEVPVHHHWRPHGRSQFFRVPAITRSAIQLLQLWRRLVLQPEKRRR